MTFFWHVEIQVEQFTACFQTAVSLQYNIFVLYSKQETNETCLCFLEEVKGNKNYE
jgi:hypothetical protein